jgi:hypothetical protein
MNYEKLSNVYNKCFSLNYLGTKFSNKLACISLTCYLTYELKKKKKDITCLDVLHKVFGETKNEDMEKFLQVLSIICTDYMYGCTEFIDFGIPKKEMPKELKKLLDEYCPF